MTSNNKPVNSSRLDRWLGANRAEQLSKNMRGWYGGPIPILDLPGGVKIHGDGDFSGPFERGYFCSAMDALESRIRLLVRRFGNMRLDPSMLQVGGFTSISNALATISQGANVLFDGGGIVKTGTASGAVGACVDLWYVGLNPGAGATAAGVAGGTVPTSASTGAMVFNNPAGGVFTMLTGADMNSDTATTSILLYDRIFAVQKTASASTTEAVTGVPTRYQSTTVAAQDYIGGNFMFVSAQSTLGAVAHNWTVCQYTNQSGAGTASFPSITGVNACAANRLDMPINQWFAPLVAGDTGVMKITQLQSSSAAVTGNANFVIGHPIGIMSFPLANYMYPFDWLTNRNLAPRIFDNAALALLQLPQAASAAAMFTGNIYGGQA